MANLTILKLGGSILTRKNGKNDFAKRTAVRLAQEIRKAHPYPLIIIHGGGRETHRLAKKFKLQGGAKTREQIIGSLKTHLAAAELTQALSEVLLTQALPIFPLQTSAIFMINNGKPTLQTSKTIEQALRQNLIPMFSGDMVPDSQVNFSILSGDTIASVLADKFKAQRIIFATDVDGLYNKDPKTYQNARLIERLSLRELKEMLLLLPRTERDATGEMMGKITKMAHRKKSIPITLVNGLKKDYLYKILIGRKVRGTYIK